MTATTSVLHVEPNFSTDSAHPHLHECISCLGSLHTLTYSACIAQKRPPPLPPISCNRILRPCSTSIQNSTTFAWRTDGRGAGGRKGQTCQTEIYFSMVHFYSLQFFLIVVKSKGHARFFSNFVWQTKCPQCWKFSLAIVHFYCFQRFRSY